MSELKPRFQVGEMVQVVNTPHYGNAFSWIRSMNRFCGKTVRITEVTKEHWRQGLCTYGYKIEGSGAMWDEDCFVQCELDIDESDVDLSVLIGGVFSEYSDV